MTLHLTLDPNYFDWPRKLNSTPLLFNLQRLTVRTQMDLCYSKMPTPEYHIQSWLPAAAEAINFFISSSRHLVLDITIILVGISDLADIFLPDLTAFGAASLSVLALLLFRSRVSTCTYTQGIFRLLPPVPMHRRRWKVAMI